MTPEIAPAPESKKSVAGDRPLPITRFALIAAAFIALIAVGLSVWNKSGGVETTSNMVDAPKGDVATVIAKLEARLKDNPKDAQGWQMLGWALFQTQKFGEAAQAYARAAQINPQKAEYWSSLGEARVMAGPGDVSNDAKSAFVTAVSLDPGDPRARYFLGVAKDMAGDHKGAINDWLALLKDTPSGAPWEADVRRLVSEVGEKEHIDVASKLGAIRPAPATGGAATATAAIPGPSREQMQTAAQMPKGQQEAMVAGMVDGLEAKLIANPKNETGWIMLMRSRIQLGQDAKSSAALKAAKAAFAGDSQALGRLDAAAAELGIKG